MVVKPLAISARPKFRTETRAVAEAAVPTVVDKLAVVTEQNIHPVVLFNSELFHAARRPVCEEDQEISMMISRIQAPSTVEHLLNEGRHDGVTLFGLARAIHSGGLRMMRKERIDCSALVAANSERVAA